MEKKIHSHSKEKKKIMTHKTVLIQIVVPFIYTCQNYTETFDEKWKAFERTTIEK